VLVAEIAFGNACAAVILSKKADIFLTEKTVLSAAIAFKNVMERYEKRGLKLPRQK